MDWPTLTRLHLLPTLYMTGLIWFVQVVHYPMFAAVGERDHRRHHAEHMRRTTWVVLPPMLAELGLAAWLCVAAPRGDAALAWTGAALLAVVWASTFLLQVPCHRRLAERFDAATHRRLVGTNWLRTAAWTARAAVAVALVG